MQIYTAHQLKDFSIFPERFLCICANDAAAPCALQLLRWLTDLLIDNAIDSAAFNARKEKHLLERRGILEEIERSNRRSPLAELFAEFERNNRELLRYEMLFDNEKRELLDIVCSNFSVGRENPMFMLRIPYREIAELEDFSECAPDRDNLRPKRILEILKKISENAISDGNVVHIVPPGAQHSSGSPESTLGPRCLIQRP